MLPPEPAPSGPGYASTMARLGPPHARQTASSVGRARLLGCVLRGLLEAVARQLPHVGGLGLGLGAMSLDVATLSW